MSIAAIRRFAVAGSFLFVAGCTWVKIPPAAEDVAIVPARFVDDCRKIGVVSANTKDTILGVNRAQKKVEEELDKLAKEQAAAINANTLVRREQADGRASYTAYQCQ